MNILERFCAKDETFYRIDFDGKWCIVDEREARDFRREHSIEFWDYTITKVRMTRRQFEALPEFEGF